NSCATGTRQAPWAARAENEPATEMLSREMTKTRRILYNSSHYRQRTSLRLAGIASQKDFLMFRDPCTSYRPSLVLLLLLLIVLGRPSRSPAQERADDEPYLPGVVATLKDTKGNVAKRLDS